MRWIFRTFMIFLALTLAIYGFGYGADYLTYKEWQPEFTTLAGTQIMFPYDVSEKQSLVFVLYTSKDCPYCAEELANIERFIVEDKIEDQTDIILVYNKAEVEDRGVPDLGYVAIIGPTKMVIPTVEFYGNVRDVGWIQIASWEGNLTTADIRTKIYEGLEKLNEQTT